MKPIHTRLIIGGVILFWIVIIGGFVGLFLYRSAEDCRKVCDLACMGSDEPFVDPAAVAECLKNCGSGGGECREACMEMATEQRKLDELQAGLMDECDCDCAD